MISVAEHPTYSAANAALRAQLTTENQAYWDQLVAALRQDPRFTDEETFQEYLGVLLPGFLAAQRANKSAGDYWHGDPLAAAQRLMKRQKGHPWWWSTDLFFPLGLFFVGLVLPTVILPAVPLQLLKIGVQLVLLVVAVILGLWLTPRFATRGQLVSWGLIAVGLLIIWNLVGRALPAVGLVYVTRKGGSLALLAVAVILTVLILWDQRRHPNSWLPALVADLWIMTVLALIARINPWSSLMVTSTGNLLIGLGTLVGDISILVSGWHIWRQRRAASLVKK